MYTNARKGSRDEGGALRPRFMLLKTFSQGCMCPEKAFFVSLSWIDFSKDICLSSKSEGSQPLCLGDPVLILTEELLK